MSHSLEIELRVARARKGLNQTQAAQEIGVSRNIISRAEQGSRTIRLDNAIKIATFYDLPLSLWGGKQEKQFTGPDGPDYR